MFLCGNYVAELDALWNGYSGYKYSLLEYFMYPFDDKYLQKYCQGQGQRGTLTVSHRYAFENLDGRTNQKFKIAQVRICKRENRNLLET